MTVFAVDVFFVKQRKQRRLEPTSGSCQRVQDLWTADKGTRSVQLHQVTVANEQTHKSKTSRAAPQIRAATNLIWLLLQADLKRQTNGNEETSERDLSACYSRRLENIWARRIDSNTVLDKVKPSWRRHVPILPTGQIRAVSILRSTGTRGGLCLVCKRGGGDWFMSSGTVREPSLLFALKTAFTSAAA